MSPLAPLRSSPISGGYARRLPGTSGRASGLLTALFVLLVLGCITGGIVFAIHTGRQEAGLAVLGGLAALATLLWRAENGVLLVIMTMPLMDMFVMPLMGVNIKASDWVAFMAIGMFILRLPFDRTLRSGNEPVRWVVLLYIMTGVVSTLLTYTKLANTPEVEGASGLNALYLRTWTQAIWGFYSLMLYVMVFQTLRTRAHLRNAIGVLLITSAAIGLYAVSGQRYWTGGGFRVLATFSEPSYFAEWLILVLPVAICLTLANEIRGGRLVQISLLFLLVVNLLLTFSTGGYISAFAALGLTLLLARRSGMMRGMAVPRFALMGAGIGILSVLVIVLSVPTAQKSLDTLLTKITNPAESTHSAMIRERARYAAKVIFADNLLVGVGPGNFPFYRPNYVADDPNATDEEKQGRWDPNNLYLEVLSERGLLGGLTFALIWLVFFSQMVHGLKISRNLYARATITGMIGSFTGLLIGYYAHANFFRIYVWVIMGIAMAAVRLAAEQEPSSEMASSGVDEEPLSAFGRSRMRLQQARRRSAERDSLPLDRGGDAKRD